MDSARLWDAVTGKQVGQAQKVRVGSAAFLLDDKKILTWDNSIPPGCGMPQRANCQTLNSGMMD
jgi:hypothetical protein